MENSDDPFNFDFSGEPQPPTEKRPYVKGDVFDTRYLVNGVLGWGAFGRVYRVTRLEDQCEFALKYFESFNATQAEASVAAEYERLRLLSHPNIPAVFETFVEPSTQRWCLVMQLIDGIGFHELIRGPMRVSPRRSARLMTDIADALDYLHGQGFYHRDLKPSNMIVDREERAWLVDFGTSRSDDEIYNVLGDSTPRYASAATGSSFNWTSEVYPLGLVLKELVIGPLDQDNSKEASFVHEILAGLAEPAFPESVPKRLREISAKSMQQRRVDAYISAGEFADELRVFVTGEEAAGDLITRLKEGENRVAAWRAGRFVGEATGFRDQTTNAVGSIKEQGLKNAPNYLVNNLAISGIGFREGVVLASRYLGRFGVLLATDNVGSAFQTIVYRHGRLSEELFKEVEASLDELKSILNKANDCVRERLANSSEWCLPAYEARLAVEQAVAIGEEQENLVPLLNELFRGALDAEEFLNALRERERGHSLKLDLDRLDRRAERLLKKNA